MHYYELLKVSPGADLADITASFNAIMSTWSGQLDSTAVRDYVRAVINAYEVLSDPGQRQAYDEALLGRPGSIDANPFERPAAWLERSVSYGSGLSQYRSSLSQYSGSLSDKLKSFQVHMDAEADRRRHPRVPVNCDVWIELDNGKRIPGSLYEFSPGGARVRMHKDLVSIGATYQIRLVSKGIELADAQILRRLNESRTYAMRWERIDLERLGTGLFCDLIF